LRFFFDNQLSPHLATAVGALAKVDGHEVTHLREKFAPNTTDVEWINALSSEGNWIVIDYGDVIVHVFKEEVRRYYNLDELWNAAPSLEIPEQQYGEGSAE
jgi:hypothetical protein